MTSISMRVNGRPVTQDVEDRRLLVDLLRDDLQLTGTKVGCAHGVCGSCTVQVNDVAVRSCLKFAVQADGCDITTVEGLSDVDGRLHPLQQAFWDNHGLQCGFCTPGFLMVAEEFLRSGRPAEGDAIREAISGNICRCTGYETIVMAVRAAVESLREADDTSAATGTGMVDG